MSLVELSERLDQRFRLLKSATVDGRHRQQTLWNTIDWSHQLLAPAEQRRFAHLSVFLGGFTVAGAAAITSDDEAVVELLPNWPPALEPQQRAVVSVITAHADFAPPDTLATRFATVMTTVAVAEFWPKASVSLYVNESTPTNPAAAV